MKRHALIIGNAGESGAQNYCQGVAKDLFNYAAFLQSPLGGGWYSSEITKLDRPSCQSARAEIEVLKRADYSIAIFSGHGCTDSKINSLRLELRTGQELSGNELGNGAKRHTAIFDCCRIVVSSTVTEERILKAVKARAYMDVQTCRQYYELAISKCPEGVVTMYACKLGEAAGDDAQSGGAYSSNLMLSAQNWSDIRNINTTTDWDLYSVVEAHEAAKSRVEANPFTRQQHPVLGNKPRSGPYFPFAVIA